MKRVGLSLLAWALVSILSACQEQPRNSTQQLSVHTDAIVRSPAGDENFYVVNRMNGDNIQVVQKQTKKKRSADRGMFSRLVAFSTNYQSAGLSIWSLPGWKLEPKDEYVTLAQRSVGRGVNPQDIVVAGKFGYVSALRSKTLLKVDLSQDGVIKNIPIMPKLEKGQVDSDIDGYPEMAKMARIKNELWVQLQKLNTPGEDGPKEGEMYYVPTGKSQISIVNLDNDRLLETIETEYTNPVTEFEFDEEGFVYLGESGYTGFHSILDGGIEKIRISDRKSFGMIVTEQTLGGDILDFKIVDKKLGFALISTPTKVDKRVTFPKSVVSFDPSTGKKKSAVIDKMNEFLMQLAYDKDRQVIYIVDNSPKNSGIFQLDVTTGKLKTDKAHATGLPTAFISLMD